MTGQVLILGGGLAGLTAALHLATDGYSVTVLEQADQVGGLLRHGPPPILLEAHSATWSLLSDLGHESATRQRRHTRLEFLQADGARVQFLHLPLPSPLNTLLGTTLFQGLSMRDRWHLLSFLERTWEQDPPLPNDLDTRAADEWLTSIGQSEHARHGVWNSLARLLLGAALPLVSAGLFMRTLRRCFLTGARATKLIIPPHGVDTFLLAPLKARLDQLGVQFRQPATVSQLHFAQHRMTGVELTDRSRLTADWYIAALPHHRLTSLLPERVVTHFAYFQQLSRLSDSSMLVVRLHLDRPADQTQLVLLEGKTFHWMIRHAVGFNIEKVVVKPDFHGFLERIKQLCQLGRIHFDLLPLDDKLGLRFFSVEPNDLLLRLRRRCVRVAFVCKGCICGHGCDHRHDRQYEGMFHGNFSKRRYRIVAAVGLY